MAKKCFRTREATARVPEVSGTPCRGSVEDLRAVAGGRECIAQASGQGTEGLHWGSRHLGRSNAKPDSSEPARCFHHYGKNLLVPLCPEKRWRRKYPLEL